MKYTHISQLNGVDQMKLGLVSAAFAGLTFENAVPFYLAEGGSKTHL